MKGILFTARGVAELIDEPTPACPDDGVRVRTIYSAVSNGTERSFLMGGPYRRPWPCRIAYQHVSQVVEVGSHSRRFAVGDVLFSATFPGHVESFTLKDTDLAVRLPPGCDLQAAAFLGMAGVAVHDVARGGVHAGDKALVFGAGLIGQFAAQAVRATGADLTVVDRHADRLELAATLASAKTIDLATPAGRQQLQAAAPFSVVLECSGGDVLDLIVGRRDKEPGLFARRSRPRLVLVAGRNDVAYDFIPAGAAELSVIHTQHFDQADLDRTLQLLLAGQIRPRPLIRDVVPLSEGPRIFATLRDEPGKLLGTVFAVGPEPATSPAAP